MAVLPVLALCLAAIAAVYAQESTPLTYAELSAPVCQPLSTQAYPFTKIAFGSCHDQDKSFRGPWEAIRNYRPDIFIWGGDNVYGDVSDGNMTELKAAYAVANKNTEYTRLRAETPVVLPIWDDHDFGLNDAGGSFPYKDQAKELFLAHWQIPFDDPRRSHDGLYYAEVFGEEPQRVQVILTDSRYFRSDLTDAPDESELRYYPDFEGNGTMIGEEQFAWLAEQLRVPAEVRIFVSTVQVMAVEQGFEKWYNLPNDLARLYNLIVETNATGLVFVSGDRHVGALYYQNDDFTGFPAYEMTASGLINYFPTSTEVGFNRIGAVYGQANFGTIDVDWWTKTITMSVRAVNGEVVRQVVIPSFDTTLVPGAQPANPPIESQPIPDVLANEPPLTTSSANRRR